jgi:double-stranded uracil-DNA glycosylase
LRTKGGSKISPPGTKKGGKPTKEELLQAQGKHVLDVIAPGLKILFCGINPGLYSGAVGHHFARPGNRFWPALHLGGLTSRRLFPQEELTLLDYGLGITNLVERATATAAELRKEELTSGGIKLKEKILLYKPKVLAVLGIGAYRLVFNNPKAEIGPQPIIIAETAIWALPNPSGLNAHYRLGELGDLFRELKEAVL